MSKDEKFSVVYKKYSGYVKNLCYGYTKDMESAEDCMHDTFIKIYQHLDGVDLNSCKSFISTIARNNTIDFLRKNKHSKYNEDIEECKAPEMKNYSYNTDDVQYKDLKKFIAKNMDKIGRQNYRIFEMYVFESLKHKEIADKLGMNINTVRVNYMKAKQTIRSLVENEFRK